jgi:hypothetical protein
LGEVLFEFVQIGQQMRVAAIDADSGVEVVILAPLQATRTQMEQVAHAKLRARLAQQEAERPAPVTGRGRLA